MKLISIRLKYRFFKTILTLFRKLIIYLRKFNLNFKTINIVNKKKKKILIINSKKIFNFLNIKIISKLIN